MSPSGVCATATVQRRRERHARSDDRSARKALVAGPVGDSTLAHASPSTLQVVDARNYEAVRSKLLELGYREQAARYDQSVFGSWFVEIEQNPPLRVIWEGKDGWLILQREAAVGRWEDVWLAKSETERTLEALIRAVASL